MGPLSTIGELARAAGVPPSTVRYYERRGLLQPESRSGSNYRLYGRESLERLRFIRAAQATGFRLRDIALLLELRDGDANPCGEVRGVIEERMRAIERELAELEHARGVLRSALRWCEAGEAEGRCGVLDRLAQRSRSGSARSGSDREGTPM